MSDQPQTDLIDAPLPEEEVPDALPGEWAAALTLLWSLTDPDDCWFDHHGGCQAHGFLSLEQGEVCPVEQSKRLQLAVRERAAGSAR